MQQRWTIIKLSTDFHVTIDQQITQKLYSTNQLNQIVYKIELSTLDDKLRSTFNSQERQKNCSVLV